MIPERNYLRAVLPSILRDDKVALVKTRHGFINLPHRLSQPTGTMMNAAETDAYVYLFSLTRLRYFQLNLIFPLAAILDLVSSSVATLSPRSEASLLIPGFTTDKPKLSSSDGATESLKSRKFSNGEWRNLLISLKSTQ